MQPTPERQALDALSSLPPQARVVVDFDDTLWLTNSTQLYVDSVRPRWLAWVLFKLVALVFRGLPTRCAPWRDAATVACLTLCCPWAWWVWRRRAPQLVRRHTNQPLAQALAALPPQQDLLVCSFGMAFLIRPLLAQMGPRWATVPLVASSVWSNGRDRQRGKRAMLPPGWCDAVASPSGTQPPPPLAVVTDSLDDQDLLALARWPLWVKWRAARDVPLFRRGYLPLRYSHVLRHPNAGFVWRVVLVEEWVGLLLVFAPAVWQAPMLALALLWLVLSFWVIYEQGYAENDRVAVHLEHKLAAPAERERFEGAFHSGERWGWCWAACLGALAVALLHWVAEDAMQPWWGSLHAWLGERLPPTQGAWSAVGLWWVMGATWVAALVGMRLTYPAYNLVQPAARVWLYPVLQLWKTLPVALLVPLHPVGLVFVWAYALSRWFPYWIYRTGGNRTAFPELFLRTVLLVVGLLSFGQLWTADVVVQLQAAAMVAYMLRRARWEGRHVSKSFVLLRHADADYPSQSRLQ